jgi:hypothetical protein
MDLNVQVSSTTGGTLTTIWSDTNFNAPINSTITMIAGGNADNSSAILTSYVDSGNQLFGQGTTVGTLGPFATAPFAGQTTGNGAATSPFSVTEVVTVTMGVNLAFGVDFLTRLPPPLPPPPTCTLASFIGAYQFNVAGNRAPTPGLTAGTGGGIEAGFLTADGNGNFTFELVFLVNGMPQGNDNHSGTYVVNPDCTGTLTFHPSYDSCFSAGPCYFPIHFDVAIAKGGSEFYLIATDPGVLASGAGVKI